MSLSHAQRAQIYEAYKTTHGEVIADLLMNTIPTVEWTDVATKADLARLELDMRRDRQADLTALELRLQRAFADMQGHQTNVLLAAMGVVVATVALLLGVAMIFI